MKKRSGPEPFLSSTAHWQHEGKLWLQFLTPRQPHTCFTTHNIWLCFSHGSYGSWSSKRFSSTRHWRRTTAWSGFLRPSKTSTVTTRRFSPASSWWVSTRWPRTYSAAAHMDFFFFYETVFNPSHSSTARLESVGGAGHRWEGNSPTHTEEFSGRHDGIPSDPTYNHHF